MASFLGNITNKYVSGEVCYPAIAGHPGSPAQTVKQNISGWNAGANSIGFLAGDGYVGFNVSGSVAGAVVGFTQHNASTAFNEASHAFFVHSATAEVVEAGVVVATVPTAHTAAQRYVIQRIGSTVIYRVGSWSYTSTVRSTDPVFLDAALYLSGDYVEDPVIGTLGELSAEGMVPLFTGSASLTTPEFALLAGITGQGASSLVMPAFTLDSTGTLTQRNRVSMTTAEFQIAAGKSKQGFALLTAPEATLESSGGFPQFAFSESVLSTPSFLFAAHGLTGQVGTANMSTAEFDMLAAEGPYGEVNMVTPEFLMLASSGPQGAQDNQSYGTMHFVYPLDMYAADLLIVAHIVDGIEVDSAEMSLVLVIDTNLFESLILDSTTLSVNELIQASISNTLAVSSGLRDATAAELQYAVNLATNAATAYTGFGFTSFVRVGLDTYGVKADGLYKIEQGDDAGTGINAAIDFGSFGFSTNKKKHLGSVWLGLHTDGQAYLRTEADETGVEKVYRIVPRGEVSRAFPDQKITAREWRVKLQVVDATMLDLDEIEFALRVTSRRWTR